MKQLQAPRIVLKLWKNNRPVLSINFRLLRRLYAFLVRHSSWDRAYLKVLYLKFPGRDNDVINDGEYFNKKDLIKAYKDFTNADLIKSTYQTIW